MAASGSRKTDGFSRQLGSSRSAAAKGGKEGDGLKAFLFYLSRLLGDRNKELKIKINK